METKRKVTSEESAGGHGMERSRMIEEIGSYAGDRAGAMLEAQVRQVVFYPALSSSSFHWFYINLILKVQQVKAGISNPPDVSGKLGSGTS